MSQSIEEMAASLGIAVPVIPEIGLQVTDGLADSCSTAVMEKVFYAKQDSFRCLSDHSVLRACTSIDHAALVDLTEYENGLTLKDLAHRDHVQGIAEVEGFFNQQYAAAWLESWIVEGCVFYSPWSKMQGIFMGDGFVRHATMTDNVIETGSQHKISICAMNGTFRNNVDASGWPVDVHLTELRIAGGGLKRIPIKVVSFTDERDCFAPATSMIADACTSSPRVIDDRTSLPDDYICLADFDLRGYRAAAMAVASHTHVIEELVMRKGVVPGRSDMPRPRFNGKPRGWRPMCEDFYDLALQFGRQVERTAGVFA